jgi:hypothetical protein
MSDLTLLGPWVRRFLLEHLVAERNLARNTQVSYRDALTTTRARPAPRVSGVVKDRIQRHADRAVKSKNHLPEGVADQQDVNTGAVEEPGHREVIGGQHDNPLAAFLHRREIGHAHLSCPGHQ